MQADDLSLNAFKDMHCAFCLLLLLSKGRKALSHVLHLDLLYLISPLYIIKMKWAVCKEASRIWGKGWEGGTLVLGRTHQCRQGSLRRHLIANEKLK